MSPLTPPSQVNAATHDPEHERRTVRALRAAITSVPFYARAGLTPPPEDAPLAEALRALPLLTPEKLRTTLPKAWVPEGRDVKAELAAGRVQVLDVGSGEARTRVLFDGAWWRAQEARALTIHPAARAALAGERGPYREAALWVPERGTGSCGAGDPSYEDRLEGARLHLNSRQDPTFWSEAVMTRMLDELRLHETTALLADPFYLEVLARHAAGTARRLDVRGFVALTRALATTSQREAIGRVADCPVMDVFSAREAGTLFVEAEDEQLHHAPFATHVELLRAKMETPGASDVALVVVTTLDREVQPLCRYVLGDLVQIGHGAGRFTTAPPIASVEGKLADALVRPDGALVTPRAVDLALAVTGAQAYQVVQRELDSVEVEIVGATPGAAKDALATLLSGMSVTARAATAIAVEPNGKQKTTRRLVPHAHAQLDSFDTGACA